MVTRWSSSTSNFYTLIGQKFDRWVHAKKLCSILKVVYFDSWSWRVLCQLVMFFNVFLHWMYKMKYSCYQESSVIHCYSVCLLGFWLRNAASWNLFTLTAEADRVFCQLVMFFTVFPHWMHKMKYSCYQQSSVIHGWFVYWIFGWEMRRLSKSQIRFRMTSFSFFTLLDAGWKVPQAAFRSSISNGKSGVIIVFVFCISNFMKSSAVYEASLCTFVLRSETMISPSMRFDISLQSFKNL